MRFAIVKLLEAVFAEGATRTKKLIIFCHRQTSRLSYVTRKCIPFVSLEKLGPLSLY